MAPALVRGDVIRRFEGFAPQRAVAETRQDGTVLVRSVEPLGPVARLTTDWLQHWASTAPDRTFLAERSGAGWRRMSFRETLERVWAIAAGLLGRGLSGERPIAILSGNSIDHALLMLAAQYVGVPTASLAEQYSLVPDARGRLTEILEVLTPGLVYVADRERFADALTAAPAQGAEIVASLASRGATPLDELAKAGTSGLEGAHDSVTPDTVAKIIFTSGSTSAPKGVVTTQRMLCVNQAQIRQVWPFLGDHPPQLVDWLPWNHVFGGSHNINMMLANGGSLYIDDGKPTAGAFGRTIENLKQVGHTISFNVPTTFALLVEHMEKDEALRTAYFRGLDLILYAGASLPQHLWEKLETMAMAANRYAPLMSSGWGMTETAPSSTMVHAPIDRAGELGAPLPGVTAKLIPGEDGRCELRVKGPNVMPGYFRDPQRTADSFDEEGYLITGDAVRLIDPADPSRGMFYEGRVAEDFKLMTGTWVQVSKLRVGALPDLSPLVADLVIAGHGSDQVGALAFPNLAGMRALGIVAEEDNGALVGPALEAALRERLTKLARRATGSSNRITRILVLAEPPSMEQGETTDKGTLNQRRVLTRRASLVARLEDERDKAVIRLGKEQS